MYLLPPCNLMKQKARSTWRTYLRL
uniref:Uncharacterized protein n=1 Tax=Anguilla anguilla TaxID=7936 RepID=A0A0E9S0J8_ANGAN